MAKTSEPPVGNTQVDTLIAEMCPGCVLTICGCLHCHAEFFGSGALLAHSKVCGVKRTE